MASSSSFVDDPTSASAPISASQRAAAAAVDDSDLDPAAFLKSVRELSEKRDREDAERYRKLEEEIEQSRQQRAARRAERARSISPEKRSAPLPRTARAAANVDRTSSPQPTTPSTTSSPAMSSTTPSEPAASGAHDVPDFKGFSSRPNTRTPMAQSPTLAETPPSTEPVQSATSLARSGTLSWQQRRPASRTPGSRPTSMVGSESVAPARNTATEEPEQSREQIAASLGARDPSWFKQTADRGVGNAAYRRNKEESASSDAFISGRRGLPGMSRDVSTEPLGSASPAASECVKSDAPSRTSSTRDSSVVSNQFSTTRTSSSSKPDLKSLIAADQAQEKAAPMSERDLSITDGEQSGLGRTPTMSSSQARLVGATERPASPTKGMGGFVQSAMMKRSDSVSKRWSAQSGSGIARTNSSAGARGGYGGLTGSHSMPKLEPPSSSTAATEDVHSKPNMQDDGDVFVKPSLPSHSRSKSVTSNQENATDDSHTSPPSSPSKRWSPTKSSWLESAITRPESPTKPAATRNSQPSWMTDIAKAKAARGSQDGTPKPADEAGSRSSSPTKEVIGQGILKRPESKELGTPRPLTPYTGGEITPRSASPTKTTLLQRSDSRDVEPTLERSTFAGSAIEPPRAAEQPQVSPTKPSEAGKQKETIDKPEIPASKAAVNVKPTSPQLATPLSPMKSPPPNVATKTKPLTPPKPPTDFRSNLRPRAPPEAKQDDQPEFLSRFGNLKKTTTQNYVAPDVLKDNITRGKAELNKTGGPVKTERKDELKESLLAKKDQWKKDKEEGVVHERKPSGPVPVQPKPEALAKRELLGRAESNKAPAVPEKPKDSTPEALARHKSLKEKPKPEGSMPGLEKQTSAPASTTAETASKPTETSKLAARFNPGLAGILARGPPAVSNPPSRTGSPALLESSSTPRMSAPSEPVSDGSQLQDMRKGRAKGPKKRKGGGREPESEEAPLAISDVPAPSATDLIATPNVEEHENVSKPKPRALPGSAASLIMASLGKQTPSAPEQAEPEKPSTLFKSPTLSNIIHDKPSAPTPVKRTAISNALPVQQKTATPPRSPELSTEKATVPEFKGFGSITHRSALPSEDNKENAWESSPSVRSAASKWGQPSPPKKADPPTQIQLPSKKDEEAAMRSAGLLASSPSRPGSRNGLGISVEKANDPAETPSAASGAPPRPAKSSRAVSGQLQEASPNQSSSQPISKAEQQITDVFGSVPTSSGPLSIDARAVITSSPHQDRVFRTVRKVVQVALHDGSLKQVSPQEEFLFFDESVYVCTHSYMIADGPKRSEIFLWAGNSSSGSLAEHAESAAKKLAKEAGNAPVHVISQGLEPPGFLQALGGILVTRQGAREGASKQYMLCGRKHLGQIVFDEVDFNVNSLCHGFAYLISYPVTLQDTRLYLWKGSAASTEEVSAARLAAMGLYDSADIIEVDGGVEFASFLKIFGPGTTKQDISAASEVWRQKALAPDMFATRLFRIQPPEAKPGVFSNFFTRRPSWNNLSPARKQGTDVKVEAKEISPFTQNDLDAEGIYLLDAHSELHVLVGPVFPSQPENVRNVLLAQTLLFANEYAELSTAAGDRPSRPRASVILSGVPSHFKMVFRHWDEGTGLWGTAGLMAGSQAGTQNDVHVMGLDEVLEVVCKT